MAFVITESCIDCKDQSCVPVCPCDCIHEGGNQLFIDPTHCIDCGLCEMECPVDAIFADDEVPPEWSHYIGINSAFFRQPKP